MKLHMRRELESELQSIRQRALAMGALCETASAAAFQAFWQGNVEPAAKTVAIEARLDADGVAIEAMVLRVVASHHPVSSDRSFLAAALRLVTYLERIGDAVVSISTCTAPEGASARSLVSAEMPDLDRQARSMLRRALRAFIDQDADAARQVLLRRDAVDRRYAEVTAKMTECVRGRGEDGTAALRVQWVAKYLECVADHAVDVAEEVISVKGDDARYGVFPSHGHKRSHGDRAPSTSPSVPDGVLAPRHVVGIAGGRRSTRR